MVGKYDELLVSLEEALQQLLYVLLHRLALQGVSGPTCPVKPRSTPGQSAAGDPRPHGAGPFVAEAARRGSGQAEARGPAPSCCGGGPLPAAP